ncbi:hypothetical protein Tco_0509904, partial [Tanacetum coccineum]
APQKYSLNQEKNDRTMSVSKENHMKHPSENLMMNLKKNLELNHLEKNNLMKNDQHDVS